MAQEKLDWTEHTGLCFKTRDILVAVAPALRPFRNEIVEDLKSKLWEICELGFYDPDKGKPSTYIVRSLLRERRKLFRQYLGWTDTYQPKWVSLDTRHGPELEHMEMLSMLGHFEPEDDHEAPTKEAQIELIEELCVYAEDHDADYLIHYFVNGNKGAVSSELSGRPYGQCLMRPCKVLGRFQQTAEYIEKYNPSLIERAFSS